MHAIAERELTLKKLDGTKTQVIVRMGAPEPASDGGWTSPVEIVAPNEDPVRFSGSGVDAFQAVTSALYLIPIHIVKLSQLGALSFSGESGHWFPRILIRPTSEASLSAEAAGLTDEIEPAKPTMRPADTWAERILEFTPNDGSAPSRLFVKIGRPYTEPGMSGAWRVDLEIQEGMCETTRAHSTGEDSFQALELATRLISILLGSWEERGKLTWAGGDHGFERP
jgi:hypothetical protein